MQSPGRSLLTALAAACLATGVRAQVPLLAEPAQSGQPLRHYPAAARGGQVDDYDGVRVADPYRWLEDTDAPAARRWIAAESTLTTSYLARLPQRAAIRARLTSLYRHVTYTAPVRAGDRAFWFENDGTATQSRLWVKDADSTAARVLLDPNLLSADGGTSVAATAPSPDGRYFAYALAAAGADAQHIRVRDVRSGRDLGDQLRWVAAAPIAWTDDARGFFYVRVDSTPGARDGATRESAGPRTERVWYHRVGRPQRDDQLIFERPDHPEWRYRPRVSDDGHYAVISISSGVDERDRLYFIDLDNPGRPRISAPIVRLFDNDDAGYHFVSSRGQTFYIRTTRNAPRGQLVAVDINQPHEAQWQPIVRESLDPMIDARQVGSRFVIHFLHDAHSRLALYTLDGQSRGEVTLPALAAVSELSTRAQDADFYYTVTSFLAPPAVYDYDTDARVDLLYRLPTLAVDLSPYETKQVFYTSRDGTQVPMFVTARKGVPLDGRNPVLLYGDGGFGVPVMPRFSPGVAAWLEMGGIYAVANVRGGGEYGKGWHESATRARKQNAFDDFTAAAQYLIVHGYTSPRRLAIAGTGNGGLLVGAVVTQHPDLFGAALPTAGIMDMLRYQRFAGGWAWTSEYGTADDSAQSRYLLAWSPLQNVRPRTRYPAVLVTTRAHEGRVAPAHSYKFAAALQAAQTADAPVLLRVEPDLHGGTGAPCATVDEATDWLAFLAQNLDVQP